MSLTTQQWRYVGAQTFGSALVASALDALYTLGTATTYQDGSARSAGSGSAWTWNRYQNAGVTEACHAAPPTDTLTQRVIYAGQVSGGAKVPTMCSPDTNTTANIMVGIVKNAGAFNAWENAAPFTSGTFSGYYRVWPTSAGTGTVYLWESQEIVCVAIVGGSSAYLSMAGAIIDPESTDTALDAESDGKLYGMMVSGAGGGANDAFLSGSASASRAFLWHNTFNGGSHAMVFTPGESTVLTLGMLFRAESTMSTSRLKTRSGRFARIQIVMRNTASAPNDVSIGRLREVFAFSDTQAPAKHSSGGTTYGYIVGSRFDTTADALFLQH